MRGGTIVRGEGHAHLARPDERRVRCDLCADLELGRRTPQEQFAGVRAGQARFQQARIQIIPGAEALRAHLQASLHQIHQGALASLFDSFLHASRKASPYQAGQSFARLFAVLQAT